MTGLEIAYLLGALGAVAIALYAIRKASERNQLDGGTTAQKRLREAREREEVEDSQEREEAQQEPQDAPPRPVPSEKADETPLPPEQPEIREVVSDVSAIEAQPEVATAEVATTDQEAGREEPGREEPVREEPVREDTVADDSTDSLRVGLEKTRSMGFVSRLGKLFGKKKIDGDVLAELEEVLFTADIGPQTADRLFATIRSELSRSELDDPQEVWARLREESQRILDIDAPEIDFASHRPFVILILGVNGAGKTTTIGKLAAAWSSQGKSIVLAAGDTFRAAATEQLEIWGQRSSCPVVKGKPGSDPSSVIFDAIKKAQEVNADVVIADTAGRLHTKVELMEELKKVGRVIDKAMPGAPHETWLVLDSTTGQNAIQQAQLFKAAMDVTGIVLTKLDGTAKGGVILGICDTLGVPVRYIGVGEQVEDLRAFAPGDFVQALYEGGPVEQHP